MHNTRYGFTILSTACSYCSYGSYILLKVCLQLYVSFPETNQWATLTSEKRDVILKALTSMESDNRPELKDRASDLKKCLASVP